MASTNGTRRTVNQPRNGQDPKGNKFANAGAAAGGFSGDQAGPASSRLHVTTEHRGCSKREGQCRP
ncbi:hypothetical protein [Streptomyces sp. DHE17-7]|uniref:hypothetical protein n=1 Tax=Streptomyces sp. DHE17-7 TaxID=2759949 RepID=UPI0022EA3FE4|nr:hypothetical protein [Streptomyces sp. DHE17-7]MBJ6623676.1 hypothetical protein [Streptomyces sp. DHE17-7]